MGGWEAEELSSGTKGVKLANFIIERRKRREGVFGTFYCEMAKSKELAPEGRVEGRSGEGVLPS